MDSGRETSSGLRLPGEELRVTGNCSFLKQLSSSHQRQIGVYLLPQQNSRDLGRTLINKVIVSQSQGLEVQDQGVGGVGSSWGPSDPSVRRRRLLPLSSHSPPSARVRLLMGTPVAVKSSF